MDLTNITDLTNVTDLKAVGSTEETGETILAAYKTEVEGLGGTVEDEAITSAIPIIDNLIAEGLYDSATGVMLPLGVDEDTLFAVKGDNIENFARASVGTRLAGTDLIVEVAANIPRIDHLTTPKILVEPAITNLIEESEDKSTWWTPSQLDPWAGYNNSETAPDGEVTADTLVGTSVSANHMIYKSMTGTISTRVLSFFGKKKDVDFFWGAIQGTTAGRSCEWNVNTGVVSIEGTAVVSAGIEDYGNGWYRCWLVYTGTTSSINPYLGYNEVSGTPSWAGNWSKGNYIWGMNMNVGSELTSYVKSSGGTATRAVESGSYTSLITSSMLSSTEGTIAYQYDGDQYAERFTSDGNKETYKNGVSTGTVVASPSETYALVNTADGYTHIYTYAIPQTDANMVKLTTF